MAKSISQIQAEVLGTSFLDKYTKNKDEYTKASGLPVLKRLLVVTTANFIIRVQENLTRLGKVSTGGLLKGIESGEITGSRGKYSVTVGYKANTKAAKYYDYVNKGVRGVKSIKPDSIYKFDNEGVSKKFQKSLVEWIKINASAAKFEDQKRKQNKLQKKRISVKKMADENKNRKSLAYAIGVSIKRKGIPKTEFFDKPLRDYFGSKFIEAVGETAKQDIQVYVRSLNTKQ